MKSTRRQFLHNTAQAALSAGALGALSGTHSQAQGGPPADLPDFPIVDTHQHLWDLSKFRLPWLKSGDLLNRSYVGKDYLEATRGLKVTKAVYMEVDVTPEQHVAEAEYVLRLCRSGELPTCAAVIGGRPADESFGAYIRRFKEEPRVKGVRHIPARGQSKEPFALEPAFVSGVRLLGELRMRFDICLPAALLDAAVKLVDQCPCTRFILDHCGNANVKVFQAAAAKTSNDAAKQQVDQWRRDVARLAGRKNVVCKISGIIATVPETGWGPDDLAPIIHHCLDCFGPDRVMFGSDWPVCTRGATLRRWVEVLREVVRARPREEQQKLFAENAVRFYGLNG
jgi:predicted TIM-barrel fold metal-dependent hydrolase